MKKNIVNGRNGGTLTPFSPGVSGLPGGPGGPRQKTILKKVMKIKVRSTDALVARMAEAFPELFEDEKKRDYTIRELIAMRLCVQAIAGKDPVPAAREILNRIEGKVPETNFKIKYDRGSVHIDKLPSELRRQLIDHMEKMNIEDIDFEEIQENGKAIEGPQK